MSKSGKELYPLNNNLSYGGLVTSVYDISLKGLKHLADLNHRAARKLEDGSFAVIGLPLAHILDKTATALERVILARAVLDFMAFMGAIGGAIWTGVQAAQAFSSGIHDSWPNLLENIGIFTGGAVIGIPLGVAAGTAVAATLTLATVAAWSLPGTVPALITGAKRSYHAIFNKKESAPVIINPVPDRGVIPMALPAPTALIKLVTPKDDFSKHPYQEKKPGGNPQVAQQKNKPV